MHTTGPSFHNTVLGLLIDDSALHNNSVALQNERVDDDIVQE